MPDFDRFNVRPRDGYGLWDNELQEYYEDQFFDDVTVATDACTEINQFYSYDDEDRPRFEVVDLGGGPQGAAFAVYDNQTNEVVSRTFSECPEAERFLDYVVAFTVVEENRV